MSTEQDAPHHESALGEPPADLEDFPRATWSVPGWRVHPDFPDAPDRGCWYFASVPEHEPSRFTLREPHGTCYAASTRRAAINEILGHWRTQPVPSSVLAGRLVTRTDVPDGSYADCCCNEAEPYGINAELGAAPSTYELTQRWAAAFYEAAFDGVIYRPRMSAGDAFALAVFGPTGPAAALGGDFEHQDLPGAASQEGYRVIRPPSGPGEIIPTEDDLEPD
ncbi:RES family NAD+ phosphorylase [Aeromicrobium sp. IC_218]|uniref:RES family NAD+ phosphorylase n=1 Tax=Aeromicrobium sp. IC_218 TaxID=2545468 RepID=UPI00103D6A10|nr:RES family NAD+ phosphorylase [Aeromicrobium sp. IC_218]TCI96406.1 RES domain-containing protein [Aeromicrobium sp. IC_218]